MKAKVKKPVSKKKVTPVAKKPIKRPGIAALVKATAVQAVKAAESVDPDASLKKAAAGPEDRQQTHAARRALEHRNAARELAKRLESEPVDVKAIEAMDIKPEALNRKTFTVTTVGGEITLTMPEHLWMLVEYRPGKSIQWPNSPSYTPTSIGGAKISTKKGELETIRDTIKNDPKNFLNQLRDIQVVPANEDAIKEFKSRIAQEAKTKAMEKKFDSLRK